MIDATGLAIGAAISWLTTHLYHRRSSRDQKLIYDKMSLELRSAIRGDHRENLSITDLNELLRRRTVDEASGDILPYIACPACGSNRLERGQNVIEDWDCGDGDSPCFTGTPYEAVKCLACGWHTSELAVADPNLD